MHEQDPVTTNTPNYRYGFLSSGVHQILMKPVGTRLDSEELRQMALGQTFLLEVLAGATFVSRGETKAASPTRAVSILDYALGPLQAMEQLRNQPEESVIEFLEKVLRVVGESLADARVKGTPDDLRGAQEFFDFISGDILATLNRGQHEADFPGGSARLV